MLISKINLFNSTSKNYLTKKTKTSFKGFHPEPAKCFEMSNKQFFNYYGGYKGIITNKQITTLKNMSDTLKNNGLNSNLAYAVFPDPVADVFVATSQNELLFKDNAKWTYVGDFDNV